MRWERGGCPRGAELIGGLVALVGLGLFGCQFPEYDLNRLTIGGQGGVAAGSSPGGSASGNGASGNGASGNVSGSPGTVDGGSGGSLSAASCGAGKVCATTAPSGWLGPMAFWQAKATDQTTPPDCPDGYDEPSDLHRGLLATTPACACSCAAQGQVCDKTASATIYLDLGCQSECAKTSPLACTAVTGCNGSQGTMRADKPQPSGGTCKATVTPAAAEPPTWQYDARLCQLKSAAAESCVVSDGTCAPTPTLPYASQLCVARVVPEGQSLPTCPAEYPNNVATLYAGFADDRACSSCACGAPSGGACSGTLTLGDGNDCNVGFEYTLGNGCQSFALASPPAHVIADYTLEKGSCGITTDTHATGSAEPSGGATVVCCL